MDRRLIRFASAPDLRHLRRLTTSFGVIQHAKYANPDPKFGYSIDDQARALIACLWYQQAFDPIETVGLISTYLEFIRRAQTSEGNFHNFYDITGRVLDVKGSADSFGRTMWALAEVIQKSNNRDFRKIAKKLLRRANASQHLSHQHLRTRAYLVLGYATTNDKSNTRLWADELIRLLRLNATKDWYWFERALIYCNAIPVYALARAYSLTKNGRYLDEAKKTLAWLDRISRIDGIVAPIGQDGWYHRISDKAHYDQQPVDAAKMVMTAAELYALTSQKSYLDKAIDWMSWYDGTNIQNKPLINHETGGIHDAITPTGVNENQGAESIVTYLMAWLSLTEIATKKPDNARSVTRPLPS